MGGPLLALVAAAGVVMVGAAPTVPGAVPARARVAPVYARVAPPGHAAPPDDAVGKPLPEARRILDGYRIEYRPQRAPVGCDRETTVVSAVEVIDPPSPSVEASPSPSVESPEPSPTGDGDTESDGPPVVNKFGLAGVNAAPEERTALLTLTAVVPELAGFDRQRAGAELTRHCLRGRLQPEAPGAGAVVVSQQPAAGTQVDFGSTVTAVLRPAQATTGPTTPGRQPTTAGPTTAGPTPSRTTDVAVPPATGDTAVPVGLLVGTGIGIFLLLLLLALGGLLLVRRRPPGPPVPAAAGGPITVFARPGPVRVPRMTGAGEGTSRSVRVEPHLDGGRQTFEEGS